MPRDAPVGREPLRIGPFYHGNVSALHLHNKLRIDRALENPLAKISDVPADLDKPDRRDRHISTHPWHIFLNLRL